MADLPLLNDDLNIVQKLDDEPNDVGGLTAAQLKAVFDRAGLLIQEFLNKQLIPAVQSMAVPGTGDFMADGSTTMTGSLNMGGNSVVNVGEPVNDTDAVNKEYADKLAQGFLSGTAGQLVGFDAKGKFAAVSPDTSPVKSSAKPLTSGGAYTALATKQEKVKRVSVGLEASAWVNNTQTVTVNGISSSEIAQLVYPAPANSSKDAWDEAGIECTGFATNSLTFTAESTPTTNITVYVFIVEVSA